MSATENRHINLYVDSKNVKKSIASTRQEVRKLNAYINKTKLSQQEYNEATKKLKGLNKVLDTHRQKISSVNKSWESVKTTAMGVGVGMLATTAIQKVLEFIPDMIDGNAKLSDSFADVRKTTGLTEEGIQSLNARLKLINTRTSRKRLLELARDAGKLGIEGVNNIAAFVKAADQIEVSLGEDLGDGAIKTIGKLNNLFKASDIYGYEQGMLKIGSVINELGAKSEATEGNIVNFTSRLAGVSVQANITVSDVAAIGATLDSLGQKTEMSATAINQTIVGMFKDTSTYAKVAGISVSKFSSLLEKDANEAFITLLEGLNGNNEGLGVLTKKFDELGINGARGIQVLSALSSNTQKLREQQKLANTAFAEGTSLTNEFNIKNNNLAADLEKVGKRLRSIWVSSSIREGMGKAVSLFKKWIDLPIDEELKKQRSSVNNLVYETIRLNTGSEERIKNIRILKNEYPQFAGFLDAEAATNKDLLSVLKQINSEYAKKIFLANKQEELTDIGERLSDATEEELEQQEQANNARAVLLDDASDKEKSMFLRNQELLINFHKLVQNAEGSHVEKVMKFQEQMQKNGLGGLSKSNLTAFFNRIAEFEIATNKRLDIEEEYNNELAKIQRMADRLRQGSGGLGDTEQTVDTNTVVVDDASTAKTETPYQKSVALIKQAMEEEMLYLEQHRAAELINAQLFEEEMLGIRLSYLLMKREAAERYGEETVAIDREITQIEIKLMELRIAIANKEDANKDKLAKKDDARQEKMIEWQKRAAQAAIESAFARGAAAIEGAKSEHEAALSVLQSIRAMIKEYIVQAVAKIIAEQIVQFGPLGLITGAVAGAAVSALFDSMIPPVQMPPPPSFALGTDSFGGSAIVGDQGREQIFLPSGSQVIPASITQMMGALNNSKSNIAQPNYSAVNSGLSFQQSQQIQASKKGYDHGASNGSGTDLTPLLHELQLLRAAQSQMSNPKVVFSKEEFNKFNDRESRNISSTVIKAHARGTALVN
jgi:TP901 family phage tail tape measure protein